MKNKHTASALELAAGSRTAEAHEEGWGQTAASLSEPLNVTLDEVLETAELAKRKAERGKVGELPKKG
jgi:hypothetical protein